MLIYVQEKFCSANEVMEYAPQKFQIFFFSHQVPKRLAESFQNVFWHSNWCVQDVPNSITLISHMLCPNLFSFHLYKLGRRGKNSHFVSTLKLQSCEVPKYQWFFCDKKVINQNKWLVAHKKFEVGRYPCNEFKTTSHRLWIRK
jgi:hypothetical protein